MPSKDSKHHDDKVFFRNYESMLHLPFVMYADFESILVKQENNDGDETKSWTNKTQLHVADGFAVYIKSIDPDFYKEPYIYTGPNAAEHFIDYVVSQEEEIRNIYEEPLPIPDLDQLQRDEFDNATECYLCRGAFVTDQSSKDFRNKKKVLDHCHITGVYRGAAHSICNLQLKIDPKTIKVPVIIHNLKGYDSHLILSAVKPRHGEIKCIASNTEKYTSFSIGGVTFLDSCQFMQSSLERLVDNICQDSGDLNTKFPEVTKYLNRESDEEVMELCFPDESNEVYLYYFPMKAFILFTYYTLFS